ncbi:trp operon leader peptide [Streptomyces sp. b94]|nr:trp operon leader peptide [Streptomyces sp. b94]
MPEPEQDRRRPEHVRHDRPTPFGAVARAGIRDVPRHRGRCAKVSRMFAHSTQNWWWTAHPAAH